MRFLILFVIFISTITFAGEPNGYSNNSGVSLQATAKYSVKPQKIVSRPTNASSSIYYQSTAGDRLFGWNGPVGSYSNAYHMGVDIWESPHYLNTGYIVNDDFVTLPMPGILIGKTNNDYSLGNALIFLHPSAGANDKNIYSVFLHNESGSIHNSMVIGAFYGASKMLSNMNYIGYVTTIGKIGGSGSAGGINHLHYELRNFPQWLQPEAENMYAINLNDFINRSSSYENPMTFSMNEVTLEKFKSIDEFYVNFALNLYYEQTSKLPQNSNECITLFQTATQNFNYARTVSEKSTTNTTNYKYVWRNNECIYRKSSVTISTDNYRIIWSNSVRPRLAISESVKAPFDTGNLTSSRSDMRSNFPIF